MRLRAPGVHRIAGAFSSRSAPPQPRRTRPLQVSCCYSTSPSVRPSVTQPADNPSTEDSTSIQVDGQSYVRDDWTNLPPHIASCISRRLHLIPSHPLSITRTLVERQFAAPTYKAYNDLSPVVLVRQNFDSLGFPQDHPGRSKTDTYYIDRNTVLRTHTSAHQADQFLASESDGFTISADVYRRDAIDRSHYPVFHQMEGARMWSRSQVPGGDIARAVREDTDRLPKHDLEVEDTTAVFHDGNPLQPEHSIEECEAITAHLKRSLEGVVVEVFGQAKKAAAIAVTALATPGGGQAREAAGEPLRVRWIEAYFPFTSPSWELEVFWQGDWLELLGCGVVKQSIPISAGIYFLWLGTPRRHAC